MAVKDSGTVNIHGKEYKTVASRVQEFREKHGDKYSIITEIVTADEKLVVMKATIAYRIPVEGITSDQAVVATGHAEEVRTSSQINRTSALENAETSAIGRALAAFGLAGTEYASADEVAQAITQQRAPTTPPQPKPQPASTVEADVLEVMTGDDAPTQAQLDRIREIRKELGYAEAQTEAKIKLLRTKGAAGASIGKLKAELDQAKGGEK